MALAGFDAGRTINVLEHSRAPKLVEDDVSARKTCKLGNIEIVVCPPRRKQLRRTHLPLNVLLHERRQRVREQEGGRDARLALVVHRQERLWPPQPAPSEQCLCRGAFP